MIGSFDHALLGTCGGPGAPSESYPSIDGSAQVIWHDPARWEEFRTAYRVACDCRLVTDATRWRSGALRGRRPRPVTLITRPGRRVCCRAWSTSHVWGCLRGWMRCPSSIPRSTPRSCWAAAVATPASPSMGSVCDAYDSSMAEAFFATLECELIQHRFRNLSHAPRRDHAVHRLVQRARTPHLAQ